MVREESMKELKQRQQRLQERTLWLKEQEESVMRKTRLCMLVMAGIFFLLVMECIWSYRRNIRRTCCD